MAINILKDKQISAAKPAEKSYRLNDGGGLYVIVNTDGSKWWRLDYSHEGKRKTLSLGVFGNEGKLISLDDARERRDDACRLIKDGIDPSQRRKDDRAANVAKAEAKGNAQTFKTAAAEWLAVRRRNANSNRTYARDEKYARYLMGEFGDVAIEEVRRRHLADALQKLEEKGKFETRMRCQQVGQNIMALAHDRDWITADPCAGAFGKSFTAPVHEPRAAIIDPAGFGELMRKIASYKGHTTDMVRLALIFLALTFVRPGTVCGARWSEIDFDGAMWVIPFARLKQRSFRARIRELNGKPHFVPLSAQALAILCEVRKLTGEGEYVFASRNGPLSPSSLKKALKALGFLGVHTAHGFRSSASTMLNAAKITTTVTVDGVAEKHELPRFSEQSIEFQLEHVDGSVAAIYNRDQKLPERIKLMQFWADQIDIMRTPPAPKEELPDSNIIQLRA
jgi:integrase